MEENNPENNYKKYKNKSKKNKNKKNKTNWNNNSKATYKESQEKFVEIITKIKDNPTLNIGPCEDYWNRDILGMSYDSYYFRYKSVRPCPFDREVMHGTTKKPSDCGCYYRCGVRYLNNTPKIKQNYLNRFLELQKQGHYSKKHIYEAGHLPPLLTKKEENEVEIVLERIEKELEEDWKREFSLRSKSENECKKNKVVIHGSNKDVLPKKLYNSIFKLIDENSSHLLFYATWDDKFVIWDAYNYVIDKKCDLNNCSISLSLYYDHLNEHKAFAFAIDNYPLHCNSIEATPELEKFYHKWKDFKKLNPDKYNEPYKQTVQEQEEAYLRSVFNSECEICMFTEHCDRVFCLKHPSEQIHSILEQELKSNTEKYVVNLHILEACNFKCRYCFAHFDYMKMLPVNIWKHIVDNVANSMHVRRFNLAGGEPLLYPDIEELIQYIKGKGFEVSIITNGFLLSEKFIKQNKNRLDCIGISVDSFDEDTLINLECRTSKNEVLDKERFLNLCKLINKCNIDLKINTVVSKLNWEQDLSDILKQIKIDRWKILKMKIFKNEQFDNSDLDITVEQFNTFVERHKGVVHETVVEDSLKNSYIMIDSEGCLVDNSEDNYEKLINVADEDFMEGFKKLSFDKDLYFSRYMEKK